MAAVFLTAEMSIVKNSNILVHVEEALADLIVVSYQTENHKFQGVLLDSTKCNLPFGVYNLNPAFTKTDKPNVKEPDKLYSVNRRFAYQDPDYNGDIPKSKKSHSKQKSNSRQKMTLRLRPRKVLCSNCQGICNENNENVDVSKKRKLETEKMYLTDNMLIPKLSRLESSDISSIKGKSTTKFGEKLRSFKSEKSETGEEPAERRELAFVSVCDSSVFCDKDDKEVDKTFSNLLSSARTLKISYGEGEGTVVKIPPLSGDFNEDSGVSSDISKPESKAVKKALKKAKKQAKKYNTSEKIMVSSYSIQSPKHIGALSPRNNVSNSPPRTDLLDKKVKYGKPKKKYKSLKQSDENSSKEDSVNYFNKLKDNCKKQKLSISLRRLSGNSYQHQDANGSDDGENEAVPEFPTNGTEGAGGKFTRVIPGDIVWGKVVGFPWWPGRVISVTPTLKAHVAWYASTTSSLMPCDSLSPFLEDYKMRFNRKKRGLYREAVKQASFEARRTESHVDPLASPTHP